MGMRVRLSRDYYDFVSIAATNHGKRASKNIILLQRVAEFKNNYFGSSWTNYGTAKPGTLHLFPPDLRVEDLRKDYRAMEEMFYDKHPTFDSTHNPLKSSESANILDFFQFFAVLFERLKMTKVLRFKSILSPYSGCGAL